MPYFYNVLFRTNILWLDMYFRKRLIKSIYFTILYWNKIKYFHFILDIKAFMYTNLSFEISLFYLRIKTVSES